MEARVSGMTDDWYAVAKEGKSSASNWVEGETRPTS